MEQSSGLESKYRSFLRVVQEEAQRESSSLNSRVFALLFWSVLLPAFLGVAILVLLRIGYLPETYSRSMGSVVLLGPLVYFLYVFGKQLLGDVSLMFRKGGMAIAMEENLKEAAWRRRVCDLLVKAISENEEDWNWIHQSFSADLGRQRQRAKTITILSGAILLFVWKGIDWVNGVDSITVPQDIGQVLAIVLAFSNGVTEWIAFFLVLILLYTSGNQTYESLKRFLLCVDQIRLELKRR